MITKKTPLILLIMSLLLLAACQPESPAATQTAPPTANETGNDSAYPAPIQPSQAYPAPAMPDEASIVRRTPDPSFDPNQPVPTPPADKATLTGFAYSSLLDDMLVDWPVFLAEVFRNPENDGAYVFDTASSPYTTVDPSGRFIFTDLEPGEYVMVVGNIEVNRYEIVSESDGRAKTFIVDPGQLLDVGTIRLNLQ